MRVSSHEYSCAAICLFGFPKSSKTEAFVVQSMCRLKIGRQCRPKLGRDAASGQVSTGKRGGTCRLGMRLPQHAMSKMYIRLEVVMMDCRQAKTSLADLSAEQLTPELQKQIEAHFADCPPCLDEWHLFQATLSTVSQATQPMPSSQQSREMWMACEKSWMERVEGERAARHSSLGSWLRVQPVWGWASLGGALAILAGVWVTPGAPQPQSTVAPTPSFSASSVPAASPDTLRMIRFKQPPPSISPLLYHHSVMAFDPFADHVATTLVSYSTSSASSPATRRSIAPNASAPNASATTSASSVGKP